MKLSTTLYKRLEIVLHSDKEYENPFLDVDIDAVFTHEDGTVITLPGFWNGDNEWKVRFSAEKAGKWTYKITCTDKDNTSLTDAGEINAAPCLNPKTELEKHGYVRLEEGKRHFVYGDGSPFFYLGDTHWQMPDYERLNECNYPGCNCGNQFLHLLKDRVAKGFNVYQTYFDSATNDGGGNKTVHEWWSEKYTRINPQAFNETMDIMMEYLADYGMTVAMGFGVHTASIRAYESNPEPILKFARYCVARYACYPTIWITAQEITDLHYNTFEIWKQVGDLVGKLDGYNRPNGAHMYPMEYSDERAQSLDATPWHQWWTLQSGHGGLGTIQSRFFYKSYYDSKNIKPYVETECQYEDIYCGGFCGCDASRVGAWHAVLSGSAGFTYGVTGVWAMGWNQKDDCGWPTYSPEPWYIGMDKPGSTEITHLKNFFEYVGWYKLTPEFGFDCGAFEMRRYVSAARIGQDVLIYYFYAREKETGVVYGLKKNIRYQARWFDPAHGTFIDLPDVVSENGEFVVPLKPSIRDWVLLLNCCELGEYTARPYYVLPTQKVPADMVLGEEITSVSVKASSFEEGYEAEHLIDGNSETAWRGFAPATSQTLVLDLGEEKDLGFIGFEAETAPSPIFFSFRTYGSNDGVNYDFLTEREGDIVAIGGRWPKFCDPIYGKYRYIKVFIKSCPPNRPKLELTRLFALSPVKEEK
ncbi:MAG: DUF4038 domain-containing protein [Clostridia bacterium]|nr:DUF4038 domain-containing protein [Clostridia bacterium]